MIMILPVILEPIAKELDDLFEAEHVHLVSAKVGTGSREPLIKLQVDLEERFITIDDCVGISKQIEAILDRSNIFPRVYRLEVSSPGLSHPLREPWEFRKHLDRKIQMHFREQDTDRVVEGYLVEIGADTLMVKTETSEIQIPFADLDYAKSIIDWRKSPSKKVGQL